MPFFSADANRNGGVVRPASLRRRPALFERSEFAGQGGGVPVVLVIAGAAAALYFFDPATAGFYPPCLFSALFGRECPGCGSLRAVHQMLHGNLAAAWALNKPIVVGLPLAALAGLLALLRRPKTP